MYPPQTHKKVHILRGCFSARRVKKKDNMSVEYRTHCRVCRDFFSHTSGIFFNSRLKPLNHNVRAVAWSVLQAFSSAASRPQCLWQDLCRLRTGTSLFVVRTPRNISHRNNTIPSVASCQCVVHSQYVILFFLTLSRSVSLTHTNTHFLTLRLRRCC